MAFTSPRFRSSPTCCVGASSQPRTQHTLSASLPACNVGRGLSLGDTCNLFDGLPNKDFMCWNVMMSGYTQQGRSNEVVQLFRLMSSAELNEVSDDTAALHGGADVLQMQELQGCRSMFDAPYVCG